jgi:drug/metabolite transporter (DMT)-like permease
MLFQNVFASVFTLQSRKLAKTYKKAHFQILCVVFGILYLVFLAYAGLHYSSIVPSQAAKFAPLSIVVGLCFTVYTALTFVMFRYVDAAIGSIFSVLNLLSVVLLSTLTINEGLSPIQLFGALLLVCAIIGVLSTHLTSAKKHKWQFGFALSLVASVFFGFAIAGQKHLLGKIGLPTYAVFGIGAEFLPLLLLSLFYGRKEYKHFKKIEFSRYVVGMGLVRGGAGLLFIAALIAANNASLIGMLSGFKIVLTAILAAVLLKETAYIRRKLLMAFVSMVGIGLMLW